MIHIHADLEPTTLSRGVRARAALSPRDTVASLTAASDGTWEVEQTVDPTGSISIIVLPTCDDPALPTFMLYEDHGLARVATIRCDVWESDQAFPSRSRAIAAIIAATSGTPMAA